MKRISTKYRNLSEMSVCDFLVSINPPSDQGVRGKQQPIQLREPWSLFKVFTQFVSFVCSGGIPQDVLALLQCLRRTCKTELYCMPQPQHVGQRSKCHLKSRLCHANEKLLTMASIRVWRFRKRPAKSLTVWTAQKYVCRRQTAKVSR